MCSRDHLGHLVNKRQDLLYHSLSTNTWKAYNTAWRSYTTLLSQLGIAIHLPLREELLEIYVVGVSDRLSYGTIKSYLSAIKFVHMVSGFSVDNLFQGRLKLLLRGIRRKQGNSRTRPKRLPIMLEDLNNLCLWVETNLLTYDAALFRAAFLLAFFGLLRVSEFTCSSISEFRENVDLAVDDVFVDYNAGLLRVRIKISKSDPFRQGFVLRIAKTRERLCPFSAMTWFLSFRRLLGPGPLFRLSNGQFLTRDHIVQVLARVFPHVPAAIMGSHSFRIGGASRLCVLGVQDATIQTLGRWASAAFKKYLHLSDQYVSELQSRMSRDVN